MFRKMIINLLCKNLKTSMELTFSKVQSGQSPGLVGEGWENEWPCGDYWFCGENKKLYERRGEDFFLIPTKSLDDLIRESVS